MGNALKVTIWEAVCAMGVPGRMPQGASILQTLSCPILTPDHVSAFALLGILIALLGILTSVGGKHDESQFLASLRVELAIRHFRPRSHIRRRIVPRSARTRFSAFCLECLCDSLNMLISQTKRIYIYREQRTAQPGHLSICKRHHQKLAWAGDLLGHGHSE